MRAAEQRWGAGRFVALVALVCLLAGCGSVPVAQDITQQQSHEIVALLAQHGISATAARETGGQGRYRIEVDGEHYTQAISLLHRHGLPGESKPSFSELVQPHGLLPNSREMEALRLDHAIATEIEETLASHPAILSARAIVRLNFLREGSGPAVSVVAQSRAGAAVTGEALAGIVRRAVPGVAPENIVISVEPAAGASAVTGEVGAWNQDGAVIAVPLVPFILGWRVPRDDYNALVLALLGILVLIAGIGGVLGYWWGWSHSTRGGFEAGQGEGARQLRIERVRRDLPES